MLFRLSGIANDSIVDGPGLRLTVFFQGCPYGCPGCHNPQTHDPLGGREADTAEIIALMDRNPLLDGLTLSGGEPLMQPAAALALAEAAKGRGLTVWLYSGSTYEEIKGRRDADVGALLALCDVLVDGPFVLREKSLELLFRGSRNQRLIDLARTRAEGRIVERQ
ncbi:MAG: anaerobic ribonucleoside-triphosphate reductase activating protein [Christensenellales bacterium]